MRSRWLLQSGDLEVVDRGADIAVQLDHNPPREILVVASVHGRLDCANDLPVDGSGHFSCVGGGVGVHCDRHVVPFLRGEGGTASVGGVQSSVCGHVELRGPVRIHTETVELCTLRRVVASRP